mgnify:FL=1
MHYVSWDRSDRDAVKLLAEGGPEVLGVFQHDRASVNGELWELTESPESGAVATRDGVEIVRAQGSLRRDTRVGVQVEGRQYTLVAETARNWIVDDAAGTKVAQFTGENSGVRKAILEFDEAYQSAGALPAADVAALAWVSRLVLESRRVNSANVLIATLTLFSIVAVLVYVL